MATTWTSPSNPNTNWRADYTDGRHKYGHAYGSVNRIRFGDHVRYGGIANQSEVSTTWS